MRSLLLSLALIPVAASAHAQTPSNAPAQIVQPGPAQIVTPNTPPGSTVVVGGARDNSGPGSDRVIAHSGTGADTIESDSASGGNAEQQTRGVPQGGGGGGGGR